MAVGDADLFEAMRQEVLERLLAIRASIDPAFGRIPEPVLRRQFDVVLGKMAQYLRTEDGDAYRRFAGRWVALRMGEGFAPETLIQSVVVIGDVVGQVAHEHMGARPEYADFLAAVTRMGFVAARMMVDNLAEELDRRVQELEGLA